MVKPSSERQAKRSGLECFELGVARVRAGSEELLQRHFGHESSTELRDELMEVAAGYLTTFCWSLRSRSGSATNKELDELKHALKIVPERVNGRTIELHDRLSETGMELVGRVQNVVGELLREMNRVARAPNSGGRPARLDRDEYVVALCEIYSRTSGKPATIAVNWDTHQAGGPLLDFCIDAIRLVDPDSRGTKESIASAIKRQRQNLNSHRSRRARARPRRIGSPTTQREASRRPSLKTHPASWRRAMFQ
jgi:hypothetical protein